MFKESIKDPRYLIKVALLIILGTSAGLNTANASCIVGTTHRGGPGCQTLDALSELEGYNMAVSRFGNSGGRWELFWNNRNGQHGTCEDWVGKQ